MDWFILILEALVIAAFIFLICDWVTEYQMVKEHRKEIAKIRARTIAQKVYDLHAK